MIQDETNSELSKTTNRIFDAAIGYKIVADIALAYAPKDLSGKIISDAEKLCNELGTSLIRDGDEVTVCLAKRHKDCKGSYVNTHPRVRRTIFCRCKCHLPNAKM